MQLAILISTGQGLPDPRRLTDLTRGYASVRITKAPLRCTPEDVAKEIVTAVWSKPDLLLLDCEPTGAAQLAMREAIDAGVTVMVDPALYS